MGFTCHRYVTTAKAKKKKKKNKNEYACVNLNHTNHKAFV